MTSVQLEVPDDGFEVASGSVVRAVSAEDRHELEKGNYVVIAKTAREL